MSYYITDIFPYLKEEAKIHLEKSLGIVLRNTEKRIELSKLIKQKILHIYLPKFKIILENQNFHIVKRLFLEGGFLEKEEVGDIQKVDFPIIDYNNYLLLPLELYEIALKDNYLYEQQYLIGLLKYLPVKEIEHWKKWLERETGIKFFFEIKKSNIFRFYFHVVFSPIIIPAHHFQKTQYTLKESFKNLLESPPLSFINDGFTFYQALAKLYYNSSGQTITIDDIELYLKDYLLLFLTGKLVPVFENNKITKIVVTKDLRETELMYSREFVHQTPPMDFFKKI